ncbi:MAG: putative tRNA threonylcarbamoyladenosine biosynthesis protein Gcp [Candidatus Jorgensenbacteria bacterium GW2011_GWA1_48_11]|uniref:tRNA N6-adenosine threonylcarbamoyltransferase n=1 Tax=Candidatus Jorgensenbacteria bacterium GW2011_GWA1_48_11 TaxID=1618660 RepID=A0A0G1XBG3_9BACT|nr:MAG: putative tRNA threonylcarbamoyladenosine biosynthesis protein Gcp [Candidatus Jorgensenbacteria bacterium GW2011_GWA1_48_11]KKW12127.1 MAG: putative tRNA threonylcarbamoyladenosine biosynthesis protein Gcp [Candidatus Jorgensenbacteria bacterium GW2011_GWB1_49_9]
MKILAIETSCDETALALVEAKGGLKSPKFRILKNIVSSQTAIHAHWGGVVPNLAKREHLKNLPILFKKLGKPKIDLLAVTVGPGLEPALWTGVNFAKELHKNIFPKAKFIGANHLEGHLYSFLLSLEYKKQKTGIKNLFPAIGLVVSGGHTILLLMKSLTRWEKLGETRDDAVGEAFDKAARMLELPYPGGPQIEKLARVGDPEAISFPRPMLNDKNYEFSFSGLKTSVLYYLRDNPKAKKADVAASFQKAASDVLITKTARAVKEFRAKSVLLSGGVAANKSIRKELSVMSYKLKVNFFVPPIKFNTDNATMIAVAAYIQFLQKKNRPIKANANLNL